MRILWSSLASIALHCMALGLGNPSVIVGKERFAPLRGELVAARTEHIVANELPVNLQATGRAIDDSLKAAQPPSSPLPVWDAGDGQGFAGPHFVGEPDFSEIEQFLGVDAIRLEISISVSMYGTAGSIEVHSLTPVPDALLLSVIRAVRRQAYAPATVGGRPVAAVLHILVSDQDISSVEQGEGSGASEAK